MEQREYEHETELHMEDEFFVDDRRLRVFGVEDADPPYLARLLCSIVFDPPNGKTA